MSHQTPRMVWMQIFNIHWSFVIHQHGKQQYSVVRSSFKRNRCHLCAVQLLTIKNECKYITHLLLLFPLSSHFFQVNLGQPVLHPEENIWGLVGWGLLWTLCIFLATHYQSQRVRVVVSVSMSWSRDVSMCRFGLISTKSVNVSVSSRSLTSRAWDQVLITSAAGARASLSQYLCNMIISKAGSDKIHFFHLPVPTGCSGIKTVCI